MQSRDKTLQLSPADRLHRFLPPALVRPSQRRTPALRFAVQLPLQQKLSWRRPSGGKESARR